MELESKKRHIPFMTGAANVKSKWDLYVEEDDYIELAYPIWRSIGNIATRKHYKKVTVPQDGVIQLPDGCEFVESVSTVAFRNVEGVDAWSHRQQHNSNKSIPDVTPDQSRVSPSMAIRQSETYTNGVAVNWELDDGIIRITSAKELANKEVMIVYKSIPLDSDGLPLLNDKELNAITFNVALVLAERDLFRKIPGADKLVSYLEPRATSSLAAAKIPENISDDALNKALDIKVSRDFKTYGTRFNFD
jgi:hypothetical protein